MLYINSLSRELNDWKPFIKVKKIVFKKKYLKCLVYQEVGN